MNIQWYPGHMTKTRRQIQADLKLVDLVAEIIIGPESTQSPAILRDYLRDNALPSLAERVSLSDCPLRVPI